MTDDLKKRLQADLNRARKDRDRFRTLVLSTALSDLRNREIELGREAGDADVVAVLSRAVKQRHDAAQQMRSGGREELAVKEESEAAILTAYLPPPLTADEVRKLARAALADGARGVGDVMGRIMPVLRGRFDGREANRIVREELGA